MSEGMVLFVDVRILKSQLDRPAVKRIEIPLKNCVMAMTKMLNSECCQRVMSCLLKRKFTIEAILHTIEKQRQQ